MPLSNSGHLVLTWYSQAVLCHQGKEELWLEKGSWWSVWKKTPQTMGLVEAGLSRSTEGWIILLGTLSGSVTMPFPPHRSLNHQLNLAHTKGSHLNKLQPVFPAIASWLPTKQVNHSSSEGCWERWTQIKVRKARIPIANESRSVLLLVIRGALPSAQEACELCTY